MSQQVPKDFFGPAPRGGELPSEVSCFRNFGSETVYGLSKFLDSLLLCGDKAILLKRLLFHLAQLDIPFIQLVAILQRLVILPPHVPHAVCEFNRLVQYFETPTGAHGGTGLATKRGSKKPPRADSMYDITGAVAELVEMAARNM